MRGTSLTYRHYATSDRPLEAKHPVAVCTRCSAFSFKADAINQRCDALRRVGCVPVSAIVCRPVRGQACCNGTGTSAWFACVPEPGWRFSRKY
jgi:hypothetical protein